MNHCPVVTFDYHTHYWSCMSFRCAVDVSLLKSTGVCVMWQSTRVVSTIELWDVVILAWAL